MPPTPRELVQIGRYLRQDQAEERGLVVLAQGYPYWIIEEEGIFCLYVDAHNAGEATLECDKFEAERIAERELRQQAMLHAPSPALQRKTSSFSLYVFVWTLCLFYALQLHEGPRWVELGRVDSNAILRGEVWRTVTALTLHASFGHLFANIATGLVFAWALCPILGTGWTWIGLILSGAAGNALNALIHRGGEHLSIGASTAVFGGLGLLVGWQIVAAIQRHHGSRNRPWQLREVALPLAAGLALLAFLGVGNGTDNVDIMAHAFGMFTGTLLGAGFAWAHLPEKTSPRLQNFLALIALFSPMIAWILALG